MTKAYWLLDMTKSIYLMSRFDNERYNESDTTEAGDKIVTVDTPFGE